jgi:hypothetical protein
VGSLTGQTQNQTALAASQQESTSALQAEQSQLNENAQMMQQQSSTDAMVNARTTQLVNQLNPGPNAPAPYQPTPLNTIDTSEAGVPYVNTTRSSLLGN